MNHEQANSVKELAALVNEALEELEWDCPECDGGRMMAEHPGCQSCRGTFKVHYSWTPQVGEYILIQFADGKQTVKCIASIYNGHIWIVVSNKDSSPMLAIIDRAYVTLIPEWQVIEEVLEKAGYKVDTARATKEKREALAHIDWYIGRTKYYCSIYFNNKRVSVAWSHTSQEAVMLVVEALGKEIKDILNREKEQKG